METRPTSFRDLLDSLRTTGAYPDVLLELHEFELAMQEVWQHIAMVGQLTEGVADELALSDQEGDALDRRRLVSSARRAAVSTSQILAAFALICRAIRTWQIGTPSSDSTLSTPIPPTFLSPTKGTS